MIDYIPLELRTSVSIIGLVFEISGFITYTYLDYCHGVYSIMSNLVDKF